MRKTIVLVCLVFLQIQIWVREVQGFFPEFKKSVRLREKDFLRSVLEDISSTSTVLEPDILKTTESVAFNVREAITTGVPNKGLLLQPVSTDTSVDSFNNFSPRKYLEETSSLFDYKPPSKWELFLTRFNLWKQFPWQKIQGNIIIKAKIGGSLPLQSPPRSIFSFPNSEKEYEELSSLEDITNLLLFGASDPRVKGILLEIGPLACGYGKLFEITRLINYFKKSNKPIIAYSELSTEKELYLASQCSQRFMPPEGILDLRGLSSSVSFYRDLFEKIGIEPQVQRLGKYKSFGDTYTRTNMSDAQREVITSLLLQSSNFWLNSMSEILKKNVSDLINLWKYENLQSEDDNATDDIWGGKVSPNGFRLRTVYDYVKLGLLSGVLYYDQVEKLLETFVYKEDIHAYDRSSNIIIRGLSTLYQKLFPKYPFQATKHIYNAQNQTNTTETITFNESYAADILRYTFVQSRATFNEHEESFLLENEFQRSPRRTLPLSSSLSNDSSYADSTAANITEPAAEHVKAQVNPRIESALNTTINPDIGLNTTQIVNTEIINSTTESIDGSIRSSEQNRTHSNMATLSIKDGSIEFPRWFQKKIDGIVLRNYLDAKGGESSVSLSSYLSPRLWGKVEYFPVQRYLRKMRRGYTILRGLPIKRTTFGSRIGIINAAGSINTGASTSSNNIGSDTMIELLREAAEDDGIKGVVLRIDSPGGSALASDLVWREIRALSRKKPVVASMVDVAASGGYYFAMACDQIVAEQLSVTGSIGVVSGKFNIKELNEKLGVATQTVSIGRFAEAFSLTRGFTEDEAVYFEESAKKAYRSFVEKAAASRSMNVTNLHEVAQGRVWTGKQAYDRGLVDELGGLWKAIDITQQLVTTAEQNKTSSRVVKALKNKFHKDQPIKIQYLSGKSSAGGLRGLGLSSSSRRAPPLSSLAGKSDQIFAVASEEVFYSGYADPKEHYGELGEFSLKAGIHPFLLDTFLPSRMKTLLSSWLFGGSEKLNVEGGGFIGWITQIISNIFARN